MRISTASSYDSVVNQLQRRQENMNDAQVKLTSGKRVMRASDDPAAAARAERALTQQNNTTADLRAVEASRSAMQQVEGALGDGLELLQQARETLVSSGNGSYSDAERRSLAEKLQSIRDQLLVVANRPDGANGYLFSAQGSALPPFVDAPPTAGVPREQTGVIFQGSQGVNQTAPHTNLPLSADGQAVWLSAKTGNGVFETRPGAGVTNAWIDGGSLSDPATYYAQPPSEYTVSFTGSGASLSYSVLRTPLPPSTVAPAVAATGPYVSGQSVEVDGMRFSLAGNPATSDTFTLTPSVSQLSVFGALDQAIADLKIPNATAAQRAQSASAALRNVDSVMGNLNSARAAAGETLSRIENEQGRLEDQGLQAQTDRSNAEDLDLTRAISDFQSQQAGYDAALKSYAMVQRMSLFQYLNG